MICDAHNGMAENIERLRDSQDKLFELSTKTSIQVAETSGHIAQLFELTAQGEEHRKATDVRLDLILEKVSRLNRKPSLAKIAAIIFPSLLGSGGMATLIALFIKGGK